jgi:broad specificity phosphatase PhoE
MIYFIRHGESEANIRHTFAGQRDDSILTKKGEEQALSTANEIKKENLKIDRVISSPLKRALKTAQIIAVDLGFDVSKIVIDDRLSEFDLGSLSGSPINEEITLADLTPDINAEDPELFRKRVISCIKELINSSENILIVSHGGVGRVLESLREGNDPNSYYNLPGYLNASITKIDWVK